MNFKVASTYSLDHIPIIADIGRDVDKHLDGEFVTKVFEVAESRVNNRFGKLCPESNKASSTNSHRKEE